ncbi:MAG: DUF2442 domain-containing protein [Alphaproteobacteria bacterium]|nr:DUF2442 domain-containing protein [Alphaproteobacteria bacterium]
MRGNDRISVGEPIPKVREVLPRGLFTVELVWDDGRRDQIDLEPFLRGFKVFRPLLDMSVSFVDVRVDEYGSGIVWTDSMSIANYTLDRLARLARPMSRDDFKDWMKRNGLTLDTAAPVLGISRRQAAAYSSGEKTIDRAVKLACHGYDAIMHSAAE